MQYKYCGPDNFEDLSSGRVLYHRAGCPNFPVRLAQEIYGRCKSYLKEQSDLSLYDPCCGAGYLLAVIGFLNLKDFSSLVGSDISREAVDLAQKNLSLLCPTGIKNRIAELNESHKSTRRESFLDAAKSAERLNEQIAGLPRYPKTHAFTANILADNILSLHDFKADIVITDVPYGSLSDWHGDAGEDKNALFDHLLPVLKKGSIVAVCSDKRQKFKPEKMVRLEKQLIGKRKFEIFAVKEEISPVRRDIKQIVFEKSRMVCPAGPS